MSNKIWPIKSDTSCLLKWGWSTIMLDRAQSYSCHRCRPNNISLEEFDNFHNTPGQISDREKMLVGEWPGDGTGCEYCRDTEIAGAVSDRQYQLSILQDPGLVAPELFDDPTSTSVTPTILEVYFKNTCNMACVYCRPQHSSQLEEEFKKYGNPWEKIGFDRDDNYGPNKNVNFVEMKEKLWKYLNTDDRYKILRRYHILGGEPFLLKELDESLDFFESHPNPNLTFSLITNLNSPTKTIEKYIDRFERLVKDGKVWKFQITGSIDAWAKEQEYVRYGMNLETFEKNFKMFAKQEWATMSINSVISSLTIRGLPALAEKIAEWNTLRKGKEPILWSSNTSEEVTSPKWFGAGYFEKYFDDTIDIIQKNNLGEINSLLGFKKRISSLKANPKLIQMLKEYLDEIDRRRNTNWRKTFSWLDQDF